MLKDLQKRILEIKVKKGFNTEVNYEGLNQEICFIAEELGELARHHRRGNKAEVIDSIVDLLIYLLGLCEMLGIDAQTKIEEALKEIETREYKRKEDGSWERVES